jgi:Ca-activated chloride channel family protein
MFNPRAYGNSRSDGIAILEVETPPGKPRQFVPLLRTELQGVILGPLADFRLIQIFSYRRSQCDKVLEAAYRFPLPGDAAVTGVEIRFGQTLIRANLQEREAAEKMYAKAKKEGKQAALVTRESPDVFTLQLAGLQPEQEIRVETTYVQLARYEAAHWQLRVPLTTSPRYVRSDELPSRHAQGQPLALMRDPGHRFRLNITVYGAEDVQSTTHRLKTSASEGEIRVTLAEGEVLPDRDFLLSWRTAQKEDETSLTLFTYQDAIASQLYFLALIAPPQHLPTQGIAREVILLEDHSGSMEGAKWQGADWATKKFLDGLLARDSFGLGLFHNTTAWLAQKTQPATTAAKQQAVQFLESHKDSGGTELGVALEQALALPKAVATPARHLLVITDAEVSDEARILRLADQESQSKDRRRISVLCIDAAPNSYLAMELAERGGGVARFLTSDPAEEDISTALDEVLQDWSQPVDVGLALEVGASQVQTVGLAVHRQKSFSRIDLGDLPSGRVLWVVGRLPVPEQMLQFRLTAGRKTLAECSLTDARPGTVAIKALFGARKLVALEFLAHANWDPNELASQLERLDYPTSEILPVTGKKKLYAENARQDALAALRQLLVKESLRFQLPCSETAFVAVREEKGKKVTGGVIVANALPVGWSVNFLAAPRGMLAAAPTMTGRMKRAVSFQRTTGAGLIAEAAISAPVLQQVAVFSGKPSWQHGQALLLEEKEASRLLPIDCILLQLNLRWQGTSPTQIDPGISLWLYVGDLAAPRAKVKLQDLLNWGGTRPLNLRRTADEVVRLVLVDPSAAWPPGLGIEVFFSL